MYNIWDLRERHGAGLWEYFSSSYCDILALNDGTVVLIDYEALHREDEDVEEWLAAEYPGRVVVIDGPESPLWHYVQIVRAGDGYKLSP